MKEQQKTINKNINYKKEQHIKKRE